MSSKIPPPIILMLIDQKTGLIRREWYDFFSQLGSVAELLTDNAIVRGDGGARGIQTSTATISDTGALSLANYIRPGTDAAAAQTASGIYAGTGVPNDANGQNGDYYFRSDGGASTHIYFKAAGVWAGII